VALPGNQAANRENKHQPIVSEETGLLDSFFSLDFQSKLMKGGFHEKGDVGIYGSHLSDGGAARMRTYGRFQQHGEGRFTFSSTTGSNRGRGESGEAG
jgi:hypothetical protein